MNQMGLHQKARKTVENYKKCEQELVDIVAQIDQLKVFYQLGFSSLFGYMTKGLGLSEAVACNISTVVRKSYQVPQLKEKVIAGEISLSKARKITPVINKSNQHQWLKIAQSKTQRQIEREVSLANPKLTTPEKVQYVPIAQEVRENVQIKRKVPRVKLEMGLSEKAMLQLRRCQDLESQRQKKHVDLESCLNALVEFYLEKHDPVKKAQRQKLRGKLNTSNSKNNAPTSVSDSKSHRSTRKMRRVARSPIPAKIKHQVQLRDQGRCTHRDKDGQRCVARRYLEFHHQTPVSKGGENTLENIRLLFFGHHKAFHARF